MANFIGTTGADILDANTSGADLVSGGAGNDTLVYEFAKAGGADRYYGGTNTDVLELRFTQAEWDGLSSATKASITAMKSAIAAATKTNGAVSAGKSFGTLDFGGGKTVTVYEVESLKLMIDGVESDGTTPAPNSPVVITSATATGNVVEDTTVKAAGTINFTDANLADAHLVGVTPVEGQTALGSFVLGAVNESATTAAGSVSWTYNLDNSSAAVQALAAGQVVTEKYLVSITDNKGSTVSQEVTITITGTYDAPVIQETDTGAVVEAGTGTPGVEAAAGKMPLDGLSAAAVWEVYTEDTQNGDGYNNGYEWGTFTITPKGQWKFTLDQAKADALAEGEELVLTFAVTATESGEASVRREVQITLTGSDDATKITAEAGADTTVVEAGGADNSIDDDAGASGKLTAVDPDDASVMFAAGTIKGTYGDLSIDADGNWGYALRNGDANVQALKDGQVVTDTVTVKATDGTTYALQITITGADDAASMSIVDTLTTLVDADGYLVNANGVQILDKNGDPQQVTIAQDKYDNLVHEAPGKDYTGKDNFVTSGKLSLVDPDGGSLLFHPLDAAERDDDLFIGSIAQGKYGSFTLNASTGEWTYTLDNSDEDTQALTGAEDPLADDIKDEVVIYSADGKSSQTITVYVKGADDGYSIIEADVDDGTKGYNTAVFEETTQDLDGDKKPDVDADGNVILVPDLEANGKLNAIDPDGDLTGNAPFAPVVLNGKYGKLEITDDQGTWTYTANTADEDTDPLKDSDGDKIVDNDVNIKSIERLAKGQVVTETFVIKTTDNAASYAINVRLTGANDKATLVNVITDADGKVTEADHNDTDGDATTLEATHSVTEAGGVNNAEPGVKVTSGVLKFKDADDGETGFATGTPATKAGLYGTFKLNATTGAWSYELDNAKANSLKANEVVQEKWEVTSKDGSKDVILVDVIGADDATTIAAATGGDYTVKEAGGINNAVKGDAAASGTLTIADPDGSAEDAEATFAQLFSTAGGEGDFDSKGVAKPVDETALVYSEPEAAASGKVWGQYGYFTFVADTGKWSYTLVDAAITGQAASTAVAANTNALAAGEKAMDVLRVYASNMSSYFDVKVNITGANDGATITNDVALADLVTQAPGFKKAVDDDSDPTTPMVAEPVTEALDLSGTLTVEDTDGGTAGAAVGFKPIAADANGNIAATYGSFKFDSTTGAWEYHLDPNDKDTRALLIGESATDKLSVTATDGTVYTINVKVNGANNAPEVLNDENGDPLVQVNGNGTITYTVADGDKGGKLTLQVVENGVTRDVTALTVNDGTVSTVKAATANSTVLYTGMMQVTDKTVGHDPAQLNTYLGMGTKNGDTIDSSAEDPSVGSLISGMDGNDTITTGAGTDYVSGGNGNDSITTDGGNDTILGDAGNDTIDAGDGDDRIVAGAGVDNLTGGAGADTFVFLTSATDFVKPTAAADVITDFTSGEDFLEFSKALLPTSLYLVKDAWDDVNAAAGKDGINEVYTALNKTLVDNQDGGTKVTIAKNGDVAGAWFRGDLTVSATGMVSAGLGTEDRFVFDASTGTLWYDADGSNKTAAVKVVDLGAGATLTADDIHFV